MFDSAILSEVQEAIVPPSRPAMESRWVVSVDAEVEKRLKMLTDSYAKFVKIWLKNLDDTKERMASLPHPVGDAPPEIIQALEAMIERTEQLAEARAIDLRRVLKKSARLAKGNSPMTRFFQEAVESSGKTDQEIVDALADYALFIRSIRAEVDPESHGGPVFSTPEDLRRYLTAAFT